MKLPLDNWATWWILYLGIWLPFFKFVFLRTTKFSKPPADFLKFTWPWNQIKLKDIHEASETKIAMPSFVFLGQTCHEMKDPVSFYVLRTQCHCLKKAATQHSELLRMRCQKYRRPWQQKATFCVFVLCRRSDSCWDRFQSPLHCQLPTYFYLWHLFPRIANTQLFLLAMEAMHRNASAPK